MSRTRTVLALAVPLLCLCLLGLPGCATSSTGQDDSTAQANDQSVPDDVAVQQAATDAPTAILAGSSDYDLSLVTAVDVVADPVTKEVRIMLTTHGATVRSGCAVGEDVARVMDGLVFTDETAMGGGSLGTLYHTWSLSITVDDEVDATLDLDGTRPAGVDAQMNWQ